MTDRSARFSYRKTMFAIVINDDTYSVKLFRRRTSKSSLGPSTNVKHFDAIRDICFS